MTNSVKGSALSSVMGKVSQILEFAQQTVVTNIEDELEKIIVKNLDSFFGLLAITLSDTNSNLKFQNSWIGSYKVPKLNGDYFQEKASYFSAQGPEYFKGRFGLSPRHNKRYTRGYKKGQQKYPFRTSLYSKIESLKNSNAGSSLYKASGGLGTSNSVSGGVSASRGSLVNGKPKKYGKRGKLINARWQDIVSAEFIRLGKSSRSRLSPGYFRTENPNKIQRPDGRVISLAQAIATGHVTFNIQGSFFRNIKEHEQGFLNFLIEHTNFLKLSNPKGPKQRDRNPNRLILNLLSMADKGRMIIDPVFGEVLDDIEYEFSDLIQKLNSSR